MPRPPRTLILNYLLKHHDLSTDAAMKEADEIVTILEEAGHVQQRETAGAAHG
jgi:hypothetical protein